jgi:hypothetical protein
MFLGWIHNVLHTTNESDAIVQITPNSLDRVAGEKEIHPYGPVRKIRFGQWLVRQHQENDQSIPVSSWSSATTCLLRNVCAHCPPVQAMVAS